MLAKRSMELCASAIVFLSLQIAFIAVSPVAAQNSRVDTVPESSPAAATPAFSLNTGTFVTAQTLTITDATPGAAIHYSLDGSNPTASSLQYTGPIAIRSTMTVTAIATATGHTQSVSMRATYTITPPAAAPLFSVPSGSYSAAQNVVLADSTPGAAIYYTTDGTTPGTGSVLYAAPIPVTQSGLIQAIAIAPGYSQSPVSSVTYSIVLPALPPAFAPAAETYNSPQTIRIFDETAGATIYYTTDGTTPSAASTPYSGAIAVAATETINAIAIAPGRPQSPVATGIYTIALPAAAPLFTPVASTYTSAQSVSITDSTAGAAIYYTTNGYAPTTASTQYSGPIPVSSSQTIRAIAVAPGYAQSPLAVASYTILLPASPPVFSPPAGSYTSSQMVAIGTSTPGAAIYYTTDGSTPTQASAGYSGAIQVSNTETINAIAMAPGGSPSAVASATYTIIPPAATPAFAPAGKTYTTAQTVTMTDATPGATIYFTTDGSTPTTSSTQYSGAIAVTGSETLNAVATAPGHSQSQVATAAYTITPLCATPAFAPPGGSYTSVQSVAITSNTPGAAIYYTTNGAKPGTSSTLYTGPLAVTATETIEAIAIAPGAPQSYTAAATYTIALPAPAPVLSLPGGTYSGSLTVSLTDANPAATIYYTSNGLPPTVKSAAYAGPITVGTSQTISTIAVAPGSSQSPVVSATFDIESPVAIATPPVLPAAYVGALYNASIQATGGSGSYTWTVNGTQLPSGEVALAIASGLTVTANGGYVLLVSGKPVAAGSVPFSVSVTDNVSGAQAGAVEFSLAVNSPRQLSLPVTAPATLGPALAHASYQGYLQVTGGVPPYSWSVAGLPGTMTARTSTAITTIAGNGSPGFGGDNGSALQAQINSGPMVMDAMGNLYIADSVTSRVRIIAPGGTISTIAGTGTAGYNGDGIPAASAQLNGPVGLAVDGAGDLFIADQGNARIRMVRATTGQITTVAGTGVAGYNGDGFAATSAELKSPSGVAVDAEGDLFIADGGNARVREVVASSGAIETVAGTGTAAFGGDGGPALQAQFRNPFAVAVDDAGNVYISDLTGAAGASGTSGRVRELFAASGLIATIAGNGTAGYNGDGIAAMDAELNDPVAIAVDNEANLYIADAGNNRLRMVSAGMDMIGTVAGTGVAGFNGDGIAASGAEIAGPMGIALDSVEDVYLADGTGRIREVQATSADDELVIEGTPAVAGSIDLQVSVQDSTGASAGPVTYPISVAAPLPLTLPALNPDTLAAGVVNQSYSGTIAASGGVPVYTWWVNGTVVPAYGTPVALGEGLTATSTGSGTLTIGGTPAAAGVISFRAWVKDGMGHLAGPVVYSVLVEGAAGYAVTGNVSFVSCGLPAAGVTVSIDTNPAQSAVTDSNGNFLFENVPNGSYIVTPSSPAPESVFSPATTTISVNSSAVTGVDFQSALGYKVSGAAIAATGVGGRTYITLVNQSCPAATLGTSTVAVENFGIRGVQPGSYTLQAWVDEIGFGAQNAANPSVTVPNIVVGNANVTSIAANLAPPAPVTLNTAPVILHGGGMSGYALLGYQPIVQGGVEQASSYTVQWSTSSSFGTIAGSRSFPAIGAARPAVWLLYGLPIKSVYYFRAQGATATSTGPWSAVFGPLTLVQPSGGYTVSGTVSFQGTVAAPMVVGFRNLVTGLDYLSLIARPVSPQSYSVQVPGATNYQPLAWIDKNQDGLPDGADINDLAGSAGVVVSGKTTYNFTMPGSDSVAVMTQHFRELAPSGPVDSYGLSFHFMTANTVPAAISLNSGPNVLAPMDIGDCTICGTDPFDFWIDIGSAVPNAGDTYSFQISLPASGGVSLSTAAASVTGVVNAFAANLSPAAVTGAGGAPDFTWTAPPNASNYTYQFTLWDENGNVIWQIPAAGASSSGFSSSIASITWGIDPTGANNPPSVASLTPGQTYSWSILVEDGNGNTSESPVTFQP